MDKKIGGSLIEPSSYFMKSPPKQYTDDDAHDKVEDFILRMS
jgi:myo-inositol-1-phosphate synthase